MPRIEYKDQYYDILPDESVLDCLTRHNISIPFSCKSGVCKACMMQTNQAPPEHAQSGLKDTQKEQNYFLACACLLEKTMEVYLPDKFTDIIETNVLEQTFLTENIIRLRLVKPDEYKYRAGQYVNLYNDDGVARSYSLASVSELDQYLEFHIRLIESGLISSWISRHLHSGTAVKIGKALGECFYVENNKEQPIILAGTGTGLGSIYGILRDALNRRHSGPITLFHGNYTGKELYLLDELTTLATKHKNFSYVPCVSDLIHSDYIRKGQIEDVLFETFNDLSGYRIYLCGNPDMVRLMKKKVFLAGIAVGDIYSDPF